MQLGRERERERREREKGERERGEYILTLQPVVNLSQVHVIVSSSQYQLVNIKEKEEGGREEGGKEIIAKDSN